MYLPLQVEDLTQITLKQQHGIDELKSAELRISLLDSKLISSQDSLSGACLQVSNLER